MGEVEPAVLEGLFLLVYVLGLLPDVLESLDVVVKMVFLLFLALFLALVGFPVLLHDFLLVGVLEHARFGFLEAFRVFLPLFLLYHEFFHVK